MKKTIYQIDFGFYIYVACGILFVPLRWFLAWLFAAAIHEICHFLVIKWHDVRILQVRLTGWGAFIQTEPMERKQEFLCALAGPLGSMAMLLCLRVAPRLAICAAIQSAYNLLPLYPFDGGRVLHSALGCLLPYENVRCTECFISFVLLSVLFGLSIVACLQLRVGLYPVVFVVLLWLRYKKSLANHTACEYNIVNRKI